MAGSPGEPTRNKHITMLPEHDDSTAGYRREPQIEIELKDYDAGLVAGAVAGAAPAGWVAAAGPVAGGFTSSAGRVATTSSSAARSGRLSSSSRAKS
jgi:hypothetical protein